MGDTAQAEKPILVTTLPELPDYEIHRDGTIVRVRGQRQGPMKSWDNCRGYLVVRLRTVYGYRSFKVHRLVCRAFHGSPPIYGEDEAHCRHIDGDPLNNHADNLRWGTRSENEHDKKRFYGGW